MLEDAYDLFYPKQRPALASCTSSYLPPFFINQSPTKKRLAQDKPFVKVLNKELLVVLHPLKLGPVYFLQ